MATGKKGNKMTSHQTTREALEAIAKSRSPMASVAAEILALPSDVQTIMFDKVAAIVLSQEAALG